MTVRIELVDRQAAIRAFHRVPRRLHGRDPRWVAPLPGDSGRAFDPRRHPTLQPGRWARWIASDGHGPVGRLAAFAPAHRPGVGYIGFFESENQHATATGLVAAAATWLAGLGCTEIHGPVPVTARDGIGVLVGGDDGPASYGCPWNPGYYPALLGAAGLTPTVRLRSYRWHPGALDSGRLRSIARRVDDGNDVRIRSLRPSDLTRDVHQIAHIINATLADAWHFEPVSHTEAEAMAHELRLVLDPAMALIAEDVDGPCGVALAIPDPNWAWHRAGNRLLPTGWAALLLGRRRIPHLRVLALGVAAHRRGSRLAARLLDAWLRQAARSGYRSAELAQVFDDNRPMRHLLEGIGLQVSRHYAVYSRTLTP